MGEFAELPLPMRSLGGVWAYVPSTGCTAHGFPGFPMSMYTNVGAVPLKVVPGRILPVVYTVNTVNIEHIVLDFWTMYICIYVNTTS